MYRWVVEVVEDCLRMQVTETILEVWVVVVGPETEVLIQGILPDQVRVMLQQRQNGDPAGKTGEEIVEPGQSRIWLRLPRQSLHRLSRCNGCRCR